MRVHSAYCAIDGGLEDAYRWAITSAFTFASLGGDDDDDDGVSLVSVLASCVFMLTNGIQKDEKKLQNGKATNKQMQSASIMIDTQVDCKQVLICIVMWQPME